MWLHSSPAWIEPGEYLLPPAERGVQPRTFPAGDVEDAVNEGWFDPNRVYVLWSAVDPMNHVGRFAFSRRDYNMYEVEPIDIGEDRDPFAVGKDWHSCARAKVLRCVHFGQQRDPADGSRGA